MNVIVPAMHPSAIEKVGRLEAAIRGCPQVDIRIDHELHAGVYARTAHLPAGCIITGAHIKVPTLLVVVGDVTMSGVGRLTGYNVLAADAHRKSAFIANEDSTITMIFATAAETVEQAEDEFTDEAASLQTRKGCA